MLTEVSCHGVQIWNSMSTMVTNSSKKYYLKGKTGKSIVKIYSPRVTIVSFHRDIHRDIQRYPLLANGMYTYIQ